MKTRTRAEVWSTIVAVLTDLLEEQGSEPGTVTPQTMLNADLGLASVDAIHLMIMLEDRFETPLNFEALAVRDGEYVQDLALGELFEFVATSVGAAG